MELYSFNYEYVTMVLKKHIFCFLSCLFSGLILSQVDLSGNWQGIIQLDGQTIEKSTLLYANFNQKGIALDGKMRDEIVGKDFYAVKRLKGTVLKNEITFNQTIIEKQKQNAQTNWCLISGTLSYNDSTGYLIGTFKSTDCKRYTGKIILYKSTAEFSATTQSPLSHAWHKLFINDYKKGFNAPEIRAIERKNFEFIPIYFESDQATLDTSFVAFLVKMIRVVDGHSDLRIKVTGHTDADGSDAYNLELSKRRAETLIDFFIQHGLSRDKIVIDFKGESLPVDNNSTSEGKQRNRRVDFTFI